jgi:L-ascorbate metabolism protein UlaG (beta-lactamase superfamily)
MNGRIGFLITTTWIISAIFFIPCSGFQTQKQFQEDIIATSAGDLKITFIGHGTLMFDLGGKVIHVDPISSAADYSRLPKANLILVTHEHGDHLDKKAIDILSTGATTVIVGPGCTGAIPSGQVMNNGESRSVEGFRVEAVPAYNLVNKRPDGNPYHPKGRGNGYVVTFGDTRVYIGGDTENTPEMKGLQRIDVAFLPMNLPFTMTPEMVADAAKAFRPRILYPYHFGNTDTGALVNLLKLEKGIDVRIRDMK